MVTRTGLPNCYRIVLRYGYAEHAITSKLGGIVYEELRKYITTELLPDGRSVAVEPPVVAETLVAEPEAVADGVEHTGQPEKEGGDSASQTSNVADPRIAQENMRHVVGTPAPITNTERDRRLNALDTAFAEQVLYVFGKEELQLPPTGYSIIQRVFLGAFLFMRDSTNEKVTSLRIPMDKVVEVGFIREL